MADSYTPNFNLTLCEVGASRDTWGTKGNANLTTIDQLLGMASPIGMLADFAGAFPPDGWLVCDGRALSRTTYSALFAVIGTAWGIGDGTTTFALPNLNGRASVGPGIVTDALGNSLSFTFAQLTGNIYNQIAQAHLPNYALTTDVQGYHNHGGATAPGGNHNHGMDTQGWHSHGGATTAGGDHTHSGYTDGQGNHAHNLYSLPASGTGAAAGSYAVTGPVFGTVNYVTDYQGTHSHNVGTYGSSIGNFALGINGDGNHAHNISYSGNFQLGIYTDGGHSHTIYLGGSSQWFPVLQPVIVVTKVIFAGTQAAVSVVSMAAADAGPMVIEGESEELLDIREELRQLRQLLTTMRGPAQQRRIAAPLRGPH